MRLRPQTSLRRWTAKSRHAQHAPLPVPVESRTEYLHPVGRWNGHPAEGGRFVWSDDSIPGYRGLPGGDAEERFWNPEKPPCVPSDHRPAHLSNSREAAEAGLRGPGNQPAEGAAPQPPGAGVGGGAGPEEEPATAAAERSTLAAAIDR